MNKEEIISKLSGNYKSLLDQIIPLSNEQFHHQKEGKWSAGQQVDHLIRSVKPLAKGISSVPKFAIQLKYGSAKEPSLSYEALVNKYKTALENGGKASDPYVPEDKNDLDRSGLYNTLQKQVDQLCKGLANYSEKDLDKLCLPHPLMGLLTLREMLYFTFYHAEHHQKLIKDYLGLE